MSSIPDSTEPKRGRLPRWVKHQLLDSRNGKLDATSQAGRDRAIRHLDEALDELNDHAAQESARALACLENFRAGTGHNYPG